MAGSRRWFNYTMDDGSIVGINADESNVETVNGGSANVPLVGTAATRQAPKGTKLRFASYVSQDGKRHIRIPILNPTIFAGIPASLRTVNDPIGTGTLTFENKTPERSKFPKFDVDTGITDGDSPG